MTITESFHVRKHQRVTSMDSHTPVTHTVALCLDCCTGQAQTKLPSTSKCQYSLLTCSKHTPGPVCGSSTGNQFGSFILLLGISFATRRDHTLSCACWTSLSVGVAQKQFLYIFIGPSVHSLGQEASPGKRWVHFLSLFCRIFIF